MRKIAQLLTNAFLTVFLIWHFHIQAADGSLTGSTISPTESVTELLNKFYKLKNQDPEAAAQTLKAVLQKDPTQTQARKELAYLYLSAKNLALALSQFKMVDKLEPNDPQVLAQVGYLLAELKQKESARAYFLKASKMTNDPVLKAQYQEALKVLSTPQPEHRTHDQLMNEFYQLKEKDPQKAQILLQTVLKNDPKNIQAHQELGYLYLKEKKLELALQSFKIVHTLQPQNYPLIMQMGYLLDQLNKKGEARTYFLLALKTSDLKLRAQAQIALKNLHPAPPKNLQSTPKIAAVDPVDRLLNKFYKLKKKDPFAAEKAIRQAIFLSPAKANLHQELGYFLLDQKRDHEALAEFKIVDQMTFQNYFVKMQLGYLLSKLHKNRSAYYYFDEVTHSPDRKLRLTANQSMSNLAGTQTKLLPSPWFADIYAYPFYYTRFNLMVYPLQARVGRTFGKHEQLETYFSWRWTRDNRSGEITNAGLLPQIYEDDVAIYAGGFKYTLFPTAKPFFKGFQIYAEGGKAQDLIDRGNDMPKWRRDFRGGLLYYNDWGIQPIYTDKPKIVLHHLGTLYSDVTYYSRYRNTIGDVIFRDGFQVLRWGTSNVNVYGKIQYLFDSQHEFYNNYVEYGPGIAFIPNHRYGLVLRVEFLRGKYIPVNGPSPNPYSSSYYNTLSMLEFYMKI